MEAEAKLSACYELARKAKNEDLAGFASAELMQILYLQARDAVAAAKLDKDKPPVPERATKALDNAVNISAAITEPQLSAMSKQPGLAAQHAFVVVTERASILYQSLCC